MEGLTASSDVVLSSSFENSIGINQEPITVWFDTNKKMSNKKMFELEIATPACIFDSKTNQWQRFITTQMKHSSVSLVFKSQSAAWRLSGIHALDSLYHIGINGISYATYVLAFSECSH